MYLLNNIKFDQNIQRTIGETQYPKGWFRDLIEREKIGVVEVPDPVMPDDNLFTSVENPDGSWTATPRTAADIASRFAIVKSDFINQVKAEAGSITQQVLQGLGSEYELAEKEATDYKAAGYPATPVPSSVQSEINSKAAKSVTITATVACDGILAAALGWRTAQAELRDKRLTVSSAASVVVDAIELDVLKAQWSDFTSTLKAQLGV